MAYANKDTDCALCNGSIKQGDEIKFKALGGGRWAPRHVDCAVVTIEHEPIVTPPSAVSPDPISAFWTSSAPSKPLERKVAKASANANKPAPAPTPPPLPLSADNIPALELTPAELIEENETVMRSFMERYAAELQVMVSAEGTKWPLAHGLAVRRIIKLIRADNGRATMRVLA